MHNTLCKGKMRVSKPLKVYEKLGIKVINPMVYTSK